MFYSVMTDLMQKDSSGLKHKHKLDPNMSRGPWEIIRLSPKDTENQVEMHKLEEFTVYDIPYHRQQKYGGLELVITQSNLPRLRKVVGHHCHIERLEDPTKPNSGEVNVYGMQKAKAMACRSFLETAVEAELTGQGEGYVWLYRDMAKSSGLKGRLGRMLRIEDMGEESSEEDDDDYIILRTAI